jgi:hypothetical protein
MSSEIPNPYGSCMCGCGEVLPALKPNARGRIARYLPGHSPSSTRPRHSSKSVLGEDLTVLANVKCRMCLKRITSTDTCDMCRCKSGKCPRRQEPGNKLGLCGIHEELRVMLNDLNEGI